METSSLWETGRMLSPVFPIWLARYVAAAITTA